MEGGKQFQTAYLGREWAINDPTRERYERSGWKHQCAGAHDTWLEPGNQVILVALGKPAYLHWTWNPYYAITNN